MEVGRTLVLLVVMASLLFGGLFVAARYTAFELNIEAVPLPDVSWRNAPPPSATAEPNTGGESELRTAREALRGAEARVEELTRSIETSAEEQAAARQSLEEIEAALGAVSEANERLRSENDDLRAELVGVVRVHDNRIADLHRQLAEARAAAGFGPAEWIAVVGLFCTIFALVIAWRKDHREVMRINRERSNWEKARA